MKKRFCFCISFAAVLLGVSVASATSVYRVVDLQRTYDDVNGLGHFDWTIQVGENPLNRFIAHRVVKVTSWHLPQRTIGPILLLPGGVSGFEMYGIGGDGASIRDQLAIAGYDVWGYSPRPSFLEAGYCDSNDCSTVADWGMDTYVDDIEIIARIAYLIGGFKRPVVGGFSMGAMLSIAAVNRSPELYQGALLWEGTLVQNDPAFQDVLNAQCTALEDTLAAGVWVDELAGPFLQGAIVLGITEPDGDSPFSPGLTNEMFLYAMTTTPVDPPDGEVPGYTYAAGDMTGWTYADSGLLLSFASQLLHYDPVALVRDYKCSYAGDRAFTGNLDAFTGPVFSIQAGHGFGATNEDTLALLENASITRMVQNSYGHGDLFTHPDFDTLLIAPLINWLESEVVPFW